MNKNDYAPIAPMGWNSYDYYDTTVNEEQVRANADYLAEHLKDAGYEYVVVDIEWYAKKAGSQRNTYQYIPYSELEIDEYSRLQPDPERFPSSADGTGFKALADYVHSLGLKFGIHIMRGIPRIAAHTHMAVKKTDWTANQIADPSSICGWNPDMYGVRNCEAGQAYYDSLLEMYAEWGVDFIKCDDICNTNIYPHNPYSASHEVEMLAKAIKKCGRSVVLSLSPGPALIEKAWHYENNANMAGRRLRARILAVLPADFVEEAVAECRKTLAGKNNIPLTDRVRKMVVEFEKLGVTQEMIEKRLGRGLDTMTAEDLTDYIGIFNSLKDKNTKVSEWFEYEKISTDISAEIDQLQTEKEQVL